MKAYEEYELVALISKPKGLKGEVIVVAPDDLPLFVFEGLEVWIVPPTLTGIRQTRIKELRDQAKGLHIALEGISDINSARELAGRYLLARSADLQGMNSYAQLPAVTEAQALQGYLGSLVFDEEQGYLGTIQSVQDNPAHPLLVVARDLGTGTQDADKTTTLLIPYVDEFIQKAVDGRIDVRLPRGLIELNQ